MNPLSPSNPGAPPARPSDPGGPFDPAELTDERRDALIEGFARMVVRRRLQAPAIFFLHMHRPLTTLASTAVTFSQPTLGIFFGFRRMAEWAALLNDRANIDRVIQRIEELSAYPDVRTRPGTAKRRE